MQALAIGGALPLPRPGWLSSPTLGRANRFLSTAAVSLMTPRRLLGTMEKVKVRSLNVEQRTREDSRCWAELLRDRLLCATPYLWQSPNTPLLPLLPTTLRPGHIPRAQEVQSEDTKSILQK